MRLSTSIFSTAAKTQPHAPERQGQPEFKYSGEWRDVNRSAQLQPVLQIREKAQKKSWTRTLPDPQVLPVRPQWCHLEPWLLHPGFAVHCRPALGTGIPLALMQRGSEAGRGARHCSAYGQGPLHLGAETSSSAPTNSPEASTGLTARTCASPRTPDPIHLDEQNQ